MRALILVDIQNDFLPSGALPVPDGDAVIELANQLQPLFDLVVATQDWHPPSHGSFAANHLGRQPGSRIELGGLPQILWPVHCVQGSPGAELAEGLERRRISRVFPKGTDANIDSYSGFFDNGHQRATGLGEYLAQQGVSDVYLAGLATDYCVKFTALDARALGFRTHLIEDACRGVNLQPGDVERAVQEMREAGVDIVHSRELSRVQQEGQRMKKSITPQVVARSNHLELVRVGDGWEYVRRVNAAGVVIVAALTRQRNVLFVEQYRPPVDARVVELPAGLAGDLAEQRDEPLEQAAMRELEEETGFRAAKLKRVFRGPSSAGLTDELATFFVAWDAERVGSGGGIDGEDIQIHEVPLAEIDAWLEAKTASGCLIGARVLTGIYLLQRELR